MVAVIDYDAGNVKNVLRACAYLGKEAELTRDPDRILSADHVILPGVGAFGDAMTHLREYGLEPVIRQVVEDGKPFLGICLGLQVLFEDSEESPGVRGLGLLPGHIRRIPAGGVKVPHMGWNSLKVLRCGDLFSLDEPDPFVYFVHAYYLEPDDDSFLTAAAEYGSVTIGAAVQRDRLFACQFHPEKSSKTGLSILRRFLEAT